MVCKWCKSRHILYQKWILKEKKGGGGLFKKEKKQTCIRMKNVRIVLSIVLTSWVDGLLRHPIHVFLSLSQ